MDNHKQNNPYEINKYYFFTKFNIFEKNKIKLNFNIFEKILDKNQFIEMKSKYGAENMDPNNNQIFIHIYLPRKDIIIPKNTMLINILDDYNLVYKDLLFKLAFNYNKELTNKYFLETYIINKNENLNKYKKIIKNNEPWYIKINNQFGGKGNFIVTSYQEFIDITNNLLHRKKSMKKSSVNKSINEINGLLINKYMTNPLLFNNKKFHLRLYYIIYINSSNVIKSFLSKYGFILTAKNDYNSDPKLYNDVDIHDSHFKSTKTDYLFPNNFIKEYGENNTQKVFNQILNIFKFISKIQANNIKLMPNSNNGYNIFGTDLLVDENFNVKLLELNKNTLLATKTNNINHFFSNYLFGNIYNEIITEVFDTEKIKTNETFIYL